MARKPKNPTRIQRSGNGHSYYLDGEKVPGVTTILSNGVPKPGLQGWAAEQTADFVVNRLAVARNAEGKIRIVADELVRDALAWNETRGRHKIRVGHDDLPRLALGKILASIRYRDLGEASAKGTEVHSLAERLNRGEEIEVPEHLVGYVEHYLRFLEEWDPVEALLERVVISRRWGYMGKADLFARFPGVWPAGTPWEGQEVGVGLLDLKTSRSGIFAETALQVAAYGNAETMLEGDEEVPIPAVDWFGAIHLRSDGYDVVRFDVRQDPADPAFRTFLYAKHVGDWLDFREGPAATVKSASLPAPIRQGDE